MLLILVGRLVSVKIDICNKIGEEVCVVGGWGWRRGGGGEGEKRRKGKDAKGGKYRRGVGRGGEIKRRGRGGEGSGRWGGRRKGKGKESLMFREQENILNRGRVEICRMGISQKVSLVVVFMRLLLM